MRDEGKRVPSTQYAVVSRGTLATDDCVLCTEYSPALIPDLSSLMVWIITGCRNFLRVAGDSFRLDRPLSLAAMADRSKLPLGCYFTTFMRHSADFGDCFDVCAGRTDSAISPKNLAISRRGVGTSRLRVAFARLRLAFARMRHAARRCTNSFARCANRSNSRPGGESGGRRPDKQRTLRRENGRDRRAG